MASGPISSWQINGETVETVADFIFLGSKITADGDCSHEIEKCLLLWRKVMANLDSILKSREITLPLDCKEIEPVHPKGDQSWVFIGKTDVEAETLIFWPPDAKSWLIWKDPDAGEDWRWEEKGTTDDEMAGWHHWLDVRESEWTPGVGDNWTCVWVNSGSWWWAGLPVCCGYVSFLFCCWYFWHSFYF